MLLTPSGNLLWKVEQKSLTAFACAKVSVKGKRHWYKAVEQTAFVALSDDSAWIIRTNGDLYLQTGNYRPTVVVPNQISNFLKGSLPVYRLNVGSVFGSGSKPRESPQTVPEIPTNSLCCCISPIKTH